MFLYEFFFSPENYDLIHRITDCILFDQVLARKENVVLFSYVSRLFCSCFFFVSFSLSYYELRTCLLNGALFVKAELSKLCVLLCVRFLIGYNFNPFVSDRVLYRRVGHSLMVTQTSDVCLSVCFVGCLFSFICSFGCLLGIHLYCHFVYVCLSVSVCVCV